MFTLYSLQFTVCSINCTRSSAQFTVYSVINCTINSVQFTVCTVQYKLYNKQRTAYSVQYTLYTIHCQVNSVQYTKYTAQCTVYRVQNTLHTLQCTVYSSILPWVYLKDDPQLLQRCPLYTQQQNHMTSLFKI